jgi:hypothetical protein
MIKVYKYLKRICKMNAREFLDLLDAYQGVYELDEAMMDGPRKDKMIAKQHSPYVSSRDRATAFNVGVRDERPRDKKSTGGKGERYSDFGDRGAGNKSRRRRGLEPIHGNTRKEEVDLYDLILTHLLDEGYADTEESATAIMANMSEDWKESICEEVLDEGFKKMNRGKIERQAKKLGGDKEIILRSLSNMVDTPEWRKRSTSQARKNRAGSGSEYRKGKELQARDDAQADIKKYGLR